jgi:uncharacterized protein (DUF4415 family)
MTTKHYSPIDLAEVADNPEWSAEDFAKAIPFAQAFPELATTIRRRSAQKAPKKRSTTIRLSQEVVEHFRQSGSGWQSRIDRALKEWIATHHAL